MFVKGKNSNQIKRDLLRNKTDLYCFSILNKRPYLLTYLLLQSYHTYQTSVILSPFKSVREMTLP